jgi:MoaA/NifB/PqqE/SkfB family radical SAM enzyme
MAFSARFLLDIFFHHLLTGRRRPFLASYKLTYRCNLRCQQCPFITCSAPDPTFTEVCRMLDKLRLRGGRLVIFEGGEPLLWRDGERSFADIVQYARRHFACVGVTTNGTLPLDVGADILWVSVDGFGLTHDRLRGAAVFDRVITNLRGAAHLHPYAHITANRENAAEIPELVRFLSEMVAGITVQFYYPYAGGDDPLFLPWPERRALLDGLVKLKRAGYPILNSIPALHALRENHWRCLPWRIDCANPEGSLWNGCYVSGRGRIDCARCGFSPYTEMSLAFQGSPRAILAGMQIFKLGIQRERQNPALISHTNR